MINRFKRWYRWQKNCLNHPFYKFLVLIGLANSPTFSMYGFELEWPDLIIQSREEE